MKKWLKIFLLSIGLLIALWFAGRVTKTFVLVRAASNSSYPTIKPKSMVFISTLVRPKRFSFICYRSVSPGLGMQNRIHRVCGLSGDTVEIREGILFVNGSNADSGLSLAHDYLVPPRAIPDIEALITFDKYDLYNTRNDTLIAYLSDRMVREKDLPVKRIILPRETKDEMISKVFGQNWNQDNFGPVVVPEGKYFLLGDNRNRSQDSRYDGFLNKSDYIATVLWK